MDIEKVHQAEMEKEKNFRPTFKRPDRFITDPKTGARTIDKAGSEEYVMLEALGHPKVIYAKKENEYYKNVQCTKTFKTKELAELGLPNPAEISEKRKEISDKLIASGKMPDMEKIFAATCPDVLDPPKAIKDQLDSTSPMDRMIRRINRSTLGK